MQAKEFDNFRKKFVFKNVNITRKVASTDQEAADKSPDTIKKIIKEKEHLPEQVFNADKSAYSRKKKKRKPQKTFTSKEEKQAPGFKVGRNRLTRRSVQIQSGL